MNFYNILWIDKNASKDDIKKAYRKLAMAYHPDRNKWDKEAEEKFKDINKAYSILSDDSKRQEYDTFWTVWNSWFWWFQWDIDISDIFESFFWWSNSSSWKRQKKSWVIRWEDLEYTINIDLKTSIYWWKEKIVFSKYIICNSCNWIWWESKLTCSKCRWTWYITYTKQSIFGVIQQTWICDKCNWTGEEFKNVCETCLWIKRLEIKKDLEIDIPAWIDAWMLIKLEWEWNDWIWTKASWDLYIKFKVSSEEKWLKRKWVDLFYDLEIDVIEAILWTMKEVSFPIIWKRKLEIKAWTQSWSIIKNSWDGVKYIDKDIKWDLYINVIVKIPKKLSRKEKELYLEIAKERNIDLDNNDKWILEKIFG